MKRILVSTALALSLVLASCAPVGKVSDFVSTATAPVSEINIYRVKNLYAGILQGFVDWRAYCWSKPYAVLMTDPVSERLCKNRRAVVRSFQEARPRVRAVIRSAESGQATVSVAWQAVTEFQALIPK